MKKIRVSIWILPRLIANFMRFTHKGKYTQILHIIDMLQFTETCLFNNKFDKVHKKKAKGDSIIYGTDFDLNDFSLTKLFMQQLKTFRSCLLTGNVARLSTFPPSYRNGIAKSMDIHCLPDFFPDIEWYTIIQLRYRVCYCDSISSVYIGWRSQY